MSHQKNKEKKLNNSHGSNWVLSYNGCVWGGHGGPGRNINIKYLKIESIKLKRVHGIHKSLIRW